MTTPEPRRRPPLQRIWDQHAALHHAVAALRRELEIGCATVRLAAAQRRIEEIAGILPEHFALEEQGGYFSDVLSVAPQFAPRAAELESHHRSLLPQLQALQRAFRLRSAPADVLLDQVRDFIAAFEHHEAGENALVRDAFRSVGQDPAE